MLCTTLTMLSVAKVFPYMLETVCESGVGVKVLGRYCCKDFVGVLQHSRYPITIPRCIKTLHNVISALLKLIDCDVHTTQVLWCLKSPQSLGNAQILTINHSTVRFEHSLSLGDSLRDSYASFCTAVMHDAMSA